MRHFKHSKVHTDAPLPSEVTFRRGVVRSYRNGAPGSGFGFIKQSPADSDDADLFFHASACPASQRDVVATGMRVEYVLGERDGRPAAISVRVI
jgi:cold shock CspA family protein